MLPSLAESGFNIDSLIYNRNVLAAELSLCEFLKQSWHITEGNTPFLNNWHIEAIAEHLEACYRREIRNLLINVPPRSCKTSLVSVAFPAWVWLQDPQTKFIYASYNQSLSTEHSLKCRRIIESDWYRERWGHMFRLVKDQNAKTRFENNKTGYRISTSIESGTTGKGGDIKILDDPNKIKGGDSAVIRETVNNFIDQTWSTRSNDAQTAVSILIQQRYHEQDASAHIMNKDIEKEWVRLILPLEYEDRRKCYTVALPSTNGEIWCDPRTEEGEVLHPARFPPEVVRRLKRDLGTYPYSGQAQQRPSPEDGGILKKSWFKLWKREHMPKLEFVIQSWDTALTGNKDSAWNACTTWGVFKDNDYNDNIILLSLWMGKVGYPELRDRAKRLYFDYRDTRNISKPSYRPVDMCLIEAKASGDILIKDLQSAGIRPVPFHPTGKGDKEGRAHVVSAWIEAGLVWIPAEIPDFKNPVPWAENFLDLMASFPKNDDSKDVVDTMSQALMKLKDMGYIMHPKDEVIESTNYKEHKIY